MHERRAKKRGSGSAEKKEKGGKKQNKHTLGRRAASGAPQGPNKRDASNLYDQSPSLQPEQG